MKAITLRNLPPEVARIVRRKADKDRTSLNKAVISMLEEQAGIRPTRKKPQAYHDLDALAGTWTKEEAETFDRALAEQRTVDPEMWK